MNQLLSEILLGVYLGLLAALFPALIAFSIGFAFKYVTDVTVPGLGVVVLGGALAGISGGLMGLLDPNVADDWTGIIAVSLILMACLWAHSVGDKLAVATPRKLTLRSIRAHKLSTDVLDRVDTFGRIRVTVTGDVDDIEGYPPLPETTREAIRSGSWKLPADNTLAELEADLAERLRKEHDLTDVAVRIDAEGNAEIAAAPPVADLSRRVPTGMRAVSIETVLPTGLARVDRVRIRLPDGDVTGAVLGARTHGVEDSDGAAPETPDDAADAGDEAGSRAESRTRRAAPTTTGGEGRVTVACPPEEARRLLHHERAPIAVEARGSRPEYEVIRLLRRGGNQFRKGTIRPESALDGASIAAAVRGEGGVAVLSIRRDGDVRPVPGPDAVIAGGDEVILAGTRTGLRSFEEAIV